MSVVDGDLRGPTAAHCARRHAFCTSCFFRQTIWLRLPPGSLKKAVLRSSLSTCVSVSKTIPARSSLGLLRGYVVDPKREMAYPALVDAGLVGRPRQNLDRHPVVIGQEIGRWIAAAVKNDMEAESIDVKILERLRVVGVNREVLDAGHEGFPLG